MVTESDDPVIRGDTAQNTAQTVRNTPSTRNAVMARLPPGPNPIRSTAGPLTVWPVTTATV